MSIPSQSDAEHDRISAADIEKMATLARLDLNPDEASRYAASLNHILSMMDRLSAIDTEGVEPLRNPFDGVQPLRDDVVNALIDREAFQAVSGAHQNGLYLVPKVIE